MAPWTREPVEPMQPPKAILSFAVSRRPNSVETSTFNKRNNVKCCKASVVPCHSYGKVVSVWLWGGRMCSDCWLGGGLVMITRGQRITTPPHIWSWKHWPYTRSDLAGLSWHSWWHHRYLSITTHPQHFHSKTHTMLQCVQIKPKLGHGWHTTCV